MGDRRSAKSREAEAVAKREEQLRNFEKSAMYYQTIREHLARTIKFDWASMFHAACAAGDRDEVRRLLADPDDADVDCLNMDGLSALHQVSRRATKMAAAPVAARAPVSRRAPAVT